MPTETRLQVNTYFDNNYFDNTSRLITGNELNAGVKKISAAFLNITDDANVNGGYMQIDNFGKVDVSKIKSASPAGYFLRDNGTWRNIVGAITWGTIGGTLSNQTDLQTALNAKFNVSAVDIDATLSGNSDSLVASQKATRTYVTASVYALSTTLGLNGILTNSNSTSGKNIILSNGDLLRSTANNVNLTFGGSGSGEFVDIITASGAEVYLENGYGVYLSQDSSGARTIEMTVTGIGITHNGNVAFSLGGDMSLIGGFKLLSQGASTVPYIDASNRLVSSAITPTELNYLSGTNSNIQNQLNNLAIGIGGWKTAARVLADSNINISSPGATINGVTMAVNDRVVLNGNTTGSENGVWVWNGAAVAMTRATDCSTGNASNTGVLGMVITIEEGTYADQFWVLTNNATITIGTTSLVYAKGSATTYTGSDGITLTGNNFTLNNSYFTGDATITAGSISIGAGKVTNAMLAGSISDSNISSSSNWNTAYTNRITSLTVTGSSGAATLASNTLNIPTYTLAGLGGTTLAAVNAQNLSVFAATTSAQLAGVISDETGTGVLVFGTAPTFTTQITTPIIYGSSASGGTLLIDSTSHATKGALTFGTAGTSNIYNFNVGSGTTLVSIQGQIGSLARPAIYFNQTSPDTTNFALSGNSTTDTYLNGKTGARLLANGGIILSAFTNQITFAPGAAGTNIVNFDFTVPANTARTASTNIPNFRITGNTGTWPTGALSTQYYNHFTQNTAAFSGASVVTTMAQIAADVSQGGNNATVTTSAAFYSIASALTNVTNGFGAIFNAPIGATTNLALGISGHMKFLTSTTLLGTAVAGLFEYNNSFYQTKDSGLRYGMGGIIFENYADAGNAGTGETDIYSYTTPASSLEANGSKITSVYGMNFNTGVLTSTRDIKVYFAGTIIFDTGALTISVPSVDNASIAIYVDIVRVSATVVRYTITANTNGASTAAYANVGELTGLTLSNTNILKVTAQSSGVGAATNDIVGKMAYGSWMAPASN